MILSVPPSSPMGIVLFTDEDIEAGEFLSLPTVICPGRRGAGI